MEKELKISLSEYENLIQEKERLKSENEELKEGKKIIVATEVNVVSNVVNVDIPPKNSNGARYAFFRESENTLDHVDFDYISKDSHNEIVEKLRKAMDSRGLDIEKAFSNLDIQRGSKIKEMEKDYEKIYGKLFRHQIVSFVLFALTFILTLIWLYV